MRNLALGSWKALISLGVALALLSELAVADKLIPVKPEENSPYEATRLQLFPGNANKAGCVQVKVDLKGQSAAIPQNLGKTVADILAALRKGSDRDLQPLFHPRLNTGLPAIATMQAKLEQTYGKPLEFSVAQLWAINTVDGSPTPVACPEGQVELTPMYGYPLQFGLWVQVLGAQELGRIYVSLVPTTSGWSIGAWHVLQWTHAGKDYLAWADAADQARESDPLLSYAMFDLSHKLVVGSRFIEFTDLPRLEKLRDGVISKSLWDKEVLKAVPQKGFQLVRSTTLLVPEGAGILLSLRFPEEVSLARMKDECQSIAKALSQNKATKGFKGIRCSFLLPGENPEKDGAQGGLYVAFSGEKGPRL